MAVDVEALYRRYGPMVLRRCRQLLKDEELSVDAAQDTFVKVLRYKNKLNANAPSSLLYRIATNICFNILRSRKNKAVPTEQDFLDAVAVSEGHEERIVAGEVLDAIFREEKESTREIAVFYYIDKMTYEQVASTIGLSVSGVRKRLRNLQSRVKERKEAFL